MTPTITSPSTFLKVVIQTFVVLIYLENVDALLNPLPTSNMCQNLLLQHVGKDWSFGLQGKSISQHSKKLEDKLNSQRKNLIQKSQQKSIPLNSQQKQQSQNPQYGLKTSQHTLQHAQQHAQHKPQQQQQLSSLDHKKYKTTQKQIKKYKITYHTNYQNKVQQPHTQIHSQPQSQPHRQPHTQAPKQRDKYRKIGERIAMLMRRISTPDVDEAVLGEQCEAEALSNPPSLEAELKSLKCLQDLLYDYRAERIALDSLPLRPNEVLKKTLVGLLTSLRYSRHTPEIPANHSIALRRLNMHNHTDEFPLPTWKIFQNRINIQSLYNNEDSEMLERLEKDLRTLKIIEISELPDHGTQVKLVLLLSDGSKALFKPKRAERESEEMMDTYYMYEKERHTAEIAAYHLNRILGFNNVPPVVGRVVDVKEEIYPFLEDDMQEQFFYSPVGNLCFFTKCRYFCDAAHAVCGDNHLLEGSLAAFLPDEDLKDWDSVYNPWKRSYSKFERADWETVEDGLGYCEEVREEMPYMGDTSILNLIDTAVFDFLMGNKDRHHLYNFNDYGNDSYFLLFDNGKGFGRPHNDILDILAPMAQCCLIRFTTFQILTQLHTADPSKRLSHLMKQSLARDLLPSLLTPSHLRALDRRVRVVLEKIVRCVRSRGGYKHVIIDDKYYYERG